MDSVTHYKTSVRELLEQYAKERPQDPNIETQVIADEKHGHYQLVNVGWENDHRIYGCVLHIDLKGDKVWIQQNMTEIPVAEELVEMGVPKEKIVIGFHSPSKRRFTEFAVN